MRQKKLSIAIFFAKIFISVALPLCAEFSESAPKTPFGLYPIPWPKDNPYSKEKAELGKLLYYDKRLSTDGSVSCATCHFEACGFSDCRPVAIGIEGAKGTRRSQSVINAAYAKTLFWDGRASSLEEQCKGPIANPNEMTLLKNPHEAHSHCQEKISEIKGYHPLFKAAFGDDEVTIDKIAKAVATFERTVLSGNSAYDRYVKGDASALSKEEILGLEVFKKARCAQCHSGPLFSDGFFTNIGIGMEEKDPDLGRYNVTHVARDYGSFKVPMLRDVEKKAPYMHDGSLKTLEEVVEYYDKGGIPNKNLHPLIVPLHLTEDEKKALVSFMKALNGEGWEHINEPVKLPE